MTRPIEPERRNRRLLIIDDHRAIHEDIRKILSAPSAEDAALDAEAAALFGEAVSAPAPTTFEIDSAYQGEEALAMVESALAAGRPYAMAFVDVRMPPGWDGIETVSRIWARDPALQVVICTAYSDYSWVEMIAQLGQTDSLLVLKKPFDNLEVLQLAHTLTQKWTLSERLQRHLADLDRAVAERTRELEEANARLRAEMCERQVAERQLVLAEQRFTRAFQASPLPMSVISLATERYIDVNDAFVSLTGRPRDELVGRTADELALSLDPGALAALLARLRAGERVRDFSLPVRGPRGPRECVVSAEIVPFDTETVALVATLDFTDQRSLEVKLRHAQKLEAVGQFAAGVAHDFNNLLTVIQGHASIQLDGGRLEPGVEASLAEMADAAARAAGLTKQLLMFSRKQIVQPRVLDLNAILENLRGLLRRVIGEHIQLACTLQAGLPSIHADQGNLEQIVMNLVVNARDAMPQGGRLFVETERVNVTPEAAARTPQARPGCFVRLTVRDTGTGMDPATVERIFEPFFTTKDVGKGTGLGLATVYGIVAHHGGWIEVQSAVGLGTSFRIFLPPCDVTAESVAAPGPANLRGGDETILVVEDEPAVRDVFSRVLRERGYRVFEAGDGPEALEVWSEKGEEVDLLFTDIVMPNGLRGHQLAERLRAERADLKVIFSTGYSADFGTPDSPLPERIRLIEKPYAAEVLVRTVRDCLDAAGGFEKSSPLSS